MTMIAEWLTGQARIARKRASEYSPDDANKTWYAADAAAYEAAHAYAVARLDPPAGAAGGSDVVSARLIPWEPGQQGVEITLTGGRSVAIPLSQYAGAAGGGSGDLAALSAGARQKPDAGIEEIAAKYAATGKKAIEEAIAKQGSAGPGAPSRCIHCDAPLTAEERKFYSTGCERCMSKFHAAMVAEDLSLLPSAPTPDLGAQGEPVAWVEVLRPFAECCDNHFHNASILDTFEADHSVLHLIRDGKLSPTGVSVGDLRRARDVVAAYEPPTPPSGVETIRQDTPHIDAVTDADVDWLARKAIDTGDRTLARIATALKVGRA